VTIPIPRPSEKFATAYFDSDVEVVLRLLRTRYCVHSLAGDAAAGAALLTDESRIDVVISLDSHDRMAARESRGESTMRTFGAVAVVRDEATQLLGTFFGTDLPTRWSCE
jgi:hypothetical protein